LVPVSVVAVAVVAGSGFLGSIEVDWPVHIGGRAALATIAVAAVVWCVLAVLSWRRHKATGR
jgi:hypothetical protein